jgi:hypothetical protein
MDLQELLNLISHLGEPDFRLSAETRKAALEHANAPVLLAEFARILRQGNREKREELVDLLADIHTAPVFELLMYALHDPHRWVRDCVVSNLKAKSEASKYFLPLIENYLSLTPDLDLTVRGRLLSVLAFHDRLDHPEDLIDAARYADFDAKEYAIKKLNKILYAEPRKKIYQALLEAYQQEYHPDIRSFLQKALHPEDAPASVFSSIQASADWFAAAALYFRSLGFYQEHSHLQEAEFVNKMKELCDYRPGVPLTHNTRLLLILAQDTQRVWYCDTEIYYDQHYVELFKKWAHISCGEFLPENISETRNEENNRIRISFSHKAQQFEIYAHDFGDWIDQGIFEELNEIISASQIQFGNIITDTQEACIVSLTASQKMSLERDLGLKFEQSGRYISPPKR